MYVIEITFLYIYIYIRTIMYSRGCAAHNLVHAASHIPLYYIARCKTILSFIIREVASFVVDRRADLLFVEPCGA